MIRNRILTVKEFLAVERNKTLEDTVADTAGTKCTDDLAFQVESVSGNGSNIPLVVDNLFMGRYKVADEQENGHLFEHELGSSS